MFDILQGIGVAAAVGIRPFLPALAVGALAAGDVQVDFKGTDYSFLQSSPFLLALVVAAIVLALAERQLGANVERGPLAIAIGAIAIGVAALLFAGALGQDRYAAWPGYIGGALCAVVAIAATRPLLARVRARLENEDAAAVPLYTEGVALALAALSVVAPPVGLIGLLLLLWLLLGGRRREGQKYAGLRILR